MSAVWLKELDIYQFEISLVIKKKRGRERDTEKMRRENTSNEFIIWSGEGEI